MPREIFLPSLRHEVDRLFDTLIHTAWGAKPGAALWAPAVDLAEGPDRFVLEFDVPGVRLEDLSITASGRSLRVEGSRQCTRRGTSERQHLVERAWGHFARTFQLPDDADLDSLRASLSEGVLTIEIPRRTRERTP